MSQWRLLSEKVMRDKETLTVVLPTGFGCVGRAQHPV